MSLLRGEPRWTSIVGVLLELLASGLAVAAPVQVFVEDFKVELDGWDGRKAESLGKALAADLQSTIATSSGFAPMTFENLESQLRKEKRAEQLSCSRSDQACIQQILDNYGCEERLYGTVRQVGDQAQVTLTRYRNEQFVPGGAASAYAAAETRAITDAAMGLARAMLALGSTSGGPAGGSGAAEALHVAPPPVVLPSGPQKKTGAVTAATGDLTIDAKPRDLVRLTITDPSGLIEVTGSRYKNPTAQPGTWKVKAEATGHHAEGRTFNVPPDEPTLEKLELKLPGGLTVTGTPAGAAVKVTGPDGFVDDGGLPAEWSGLGSGTYEVSVTRAGYADVSQSVAVPPGQVAVVNVALEKAVAVGVSRAANGMVTIPAGEFWMGCNPSIDTECSGDERPGRKVTLDDYRIDLREVTVAEYAACAKAGRCSNPNTGGMCTWGQPGRDQHPVNCVDWSQAKAYCEWAGKRLPSEAEWEKAARGTDGRKFPWGDQVVSCDLAVWGDGSNADGCGQTGTWPVCSKMEGNSPFGLCDMAGNVWEWVQDAYGAYDAGVARNPTHDRGVGHVVRGGSWLDDVAGTLRAGYRKGNDPASSASLGFRCAAGGLQN